MRLVISPFKKDLGKAIKYVHAHEPQLIKGIDFGLVDNISINAIAISEGCNEIIGINVGVALIIPMIFNWLLSHPDIFIDIGDPTREMAPEPFNIELLTKQRPWGSIEKDEIKLFQPRDPVRAHHAFWMSTVAWNFLFFHELAHINRCHIDYLSRCLRLSRRMTSWHEFRRLKTEKESRLRQVLEIDADGVAGKVIAGGPRLTGLERMKRLAFGATGGSEASWNWQRVYKIWLQCIALLFQIMAITDSEANVNNPLRTHPHPDVRMELLFEFIWQQWSKLIYDEGKLNEISRETSQETHEIFTRGILPMPRNRIDRSYSDSGREIINGMRDALYSIADDLNALTQKRWEKVSGTLSNPTKVR